MGAVLGRHIVRQHRKTRIVAHPNIKLLSRTYPTTYVNFPSPYGGPDFVSNGACVTATTPLILPTNSEQGLIYPVTISNWDTRLPWNVTQQLLDYLDSIPAVSQKFHGTKVGKCEWITYVTPTTSILPVTKVTVQYL